MQKELQDFIDSIRAQGKSKNTIDAYSLDLSSFVDFLKNSNIASVYDATSEIVEKYKNYLAGEGKSKSSICRKLSSLRAFYKYLSEKNGCNNPLLEVKNIKCDEKELEILSPKEIELLLYQPDVKNVKGLRDRAMLETLYATGMRVSEVIALNKDDVNLTVEFIRCNVKNHERVIPIYNVAAELLHEYITKSRSKLCDKCPDEKALFVNINGERMTRQGFWKILKHYVKEAGITKDVTPHTLRHSFAAHLLENGASMNDIKDILGHTDISSMQMYSKYLKSKLRSTYIMHHPRAKI